MTKENEIILKLIHWKKPRLTNTDLGITIDVQNCWNQPHLPYRQYINTSEKLVFYPFFLHKAKIYSCHSLLDGIQAHTHLEYLQD